MSEAAPQWPRGVDPQLVADCNCAGCQALVGALVATWAAARVSQRQGLGRFVDEAQGVSA